MRLLTATALLAAALPAWGQAPAPAADLKTAISQLAALDYPVRMNAARLIRRAPLAVVVPALIDVVKNDADQFVRYRALVLLTAFNDRGTGALIRSLLADRNDRLREVVYRWLEQSPDAEMRFPLLAALQTEQAEFVRPALVAALAAQAGDAEVQRALTQEVTRGLDFFRSATIEALGRHRAAYAIDAIGGVATLDGPLQHDAVLALGRIGGDRARAALAAVQNPRPEIQQSLRAALCLLGDDCDAAIAALGDAAAAPRSFPDVVRTAMNGLASIAASGRGAASSALLELSRRSQPLRDRAAAAMAASALHDPDRSLAWLNAAADADRTAAVALLKDGFDDLEEDFAEEQFFAATRASYWAAAESSPARSLAAALIQQLEF